MVLDSSNTPFKGEQRVSVNISSASVGSHAVNEEVSRGELAEPAVGFQEENVLHGSGDPLEATAGNIEIEDIEDGEEDNLRRVHPVDEDSDAEDLIDGSWYEGSANGSVRSPTLDQFHELSNDYLQNCQSEKVFVCHNVNIPLCRKQQIRGSLFLIRSPPTPEGEHIVFWLPKATIMEVNPDLLTPQDRASEERRIAEGKGSVKYELLYSQRILAKDIFAVKNEGRCVVLNVYKGSEIDSVTFDFVSGGKQKFKTVIAPLMRQQPIDYCEWLYKGEDKKPNKANELKKKVSNFMVGAMTLWSTMAQNDDEKSIDSEEDHPQFAHSCSITKPMFKSSTRPVVAAELSSAPDKSLDLAEYKRIVFNSLGCGLDTETQSHREVRSEVWAKMLRLDEGYDELAVDYQIYLHQFMGLTEEQLQYCSWVTKQDISIKKDIIRTDRDIDIFDDVNSEFIEMERRILLAYCMYNRDLGYVQGMSDLAAMMIFVFREEVVAFHAFKRLVDGMIPAFNDHGACQRQTLKSLVQVMSPNLASHLSKEDPDFMFAFRWVFLLFKREFRFHQVAVLWDCLLSAPVPNFHLFIGAVLLCNFEDQLQQLEGAQLMRFCQNIEGNVEIQEVIPVIQDKWETYHLNDVVMGLLRGECPPSPK
eukprot:TRINITY_DN1631_c1_g1_i1.p1 TRINITY_DN1631_c1_g1~~TRINITY_DN1631_c1_g1_i1.p1  ORF type:complete len:645 (+),score=137.94 TRINITY_DN1631_c1_g1_i1:112-2046(+)